MKVGFTGTRHGTTKAQHAGLAELLEARRDLSGIDEVQHGDCVGADEQFHGVAVALGIPTRVRPPTDAKHRAFCKASLGEAPAKGYLERDRDIVDSTHYMIACPRETHEPPPRRGQGTWYTVRYARKRNRAVFIVWPDGHVSFEG